MKSNLEVYRCRLTTLGPVFIGKGSELSKKEYLFLNNKKTVGIIDIEKFYTIVARKGAAHRFEQYMMNPRDKMNLGQWMKAEKISWAEVDSCLKYTIDSGDTVIQRGTPIQIAECLKDPYGFPYIPGSSIKGILRTVLLARRIAEESERFRNDKNEIIRTIKSTHGKVRRTSFLQGESRAVEQTAFYQLRRNEKRKGDAVNDEVSGLIVSDSIPLRIKDMVLCQKIEYQVDGTEKRLNLLRECIKPGITLEFTITIEKDICSIRKEEIMQGMKIFNKMYYENFLQAFSGAKRPVPNQIYLGGGTGFVSKTVVYPLFGKIEGLNMVIDIFRYTGVPQNHKHEKDRQYGASPHILKCTRYDGKIMEMGKSILEIL